MIYFEKDKNINFKEIYHPSQRISSLNNTFIVFIETNQMLKYTFISFLCEYPSKSMLKVLSNEKNV